MKNSVTFYTLLYINENESSLGNGVSGTYEEKIKKYCACCRALNDSLALHGNYDFYVITNKPEMVKEPGLKTLEISFKTKVDPRVPFASAHCKLDVFNYFSSLHKNQYSVLLDSDVLCINSESTLLSRISAGYPMIYDITDQQFQGIEGGSERICKDKEFLIRKAFSAKDFVSCGLWAGGEFIGGNADFYKALYSACKKILPVYIENHKKLFHNGDEMIVSCALEYLIQQKKIFAFDAGTHGIIGRYYDSSTNHIQHIWKYFKKNMFVHLPMDKDFLSSDRLNFSSSEAFLKSIEVELFRNKTFINATVRADCALQKLTALFYKARAIIKRLSGRGSAPVEY
ncbi:hypothetical protein [Treponema sp.]|uniref:hypothetical protein n=1 Tax=Treponema sp. TaxID=166 RepID=UPI00298D997C|nr:hypothetical protein [Treponema sp.]MCR5612189.1 hypothetical protein [Treponema sp.]